MNIKTNVVFSISAFTAVVSLFAAGPLVATQQAHAQWWDGGYGDYGGYPYGGYYDPGSPPPYAYCSYADYKSNVVSYGDCYPFGY
jgi:hypothetical protein